MPGITAVKRYVKHIPARSDGFEEEVNKALTQLHSENYEIRDIKYAVSQSGYPTAMIEYYKG